MRGINGRVVSMPLTDMRGISNRVESISSALCGGFVLGEKMVINGFYILKDEYFEIMQDPNLKNNKDGNRPFYYCLQDNNNKDLFWMVPLSSRVEKFRTIIEKKISENKPCDGIYICKLPSGKESVFLIQDIFPIYSRFVEREYTLAGNHLILPYENDIKAISKRASKICALVKRGIKLTPTSPDIIKILSILSSLTK